MTDRHVISPYPIRMPADLRNTLEESARNGNRSLHAEIIARLEAGAAPELPPDSIVPASKARELAALARKDLAKRVRNAIIEDINDAIQRGSAVCFAALADFDLEELSDREFEDVVSETEQELRAAGYTIEWQDRECLAIGFSE